MVPADPHGNLVLSRLRRILAWHIARRPGGLVTLAIQYGHMRTALDARTSTGYGDRGRRGFHGELDVETALAAAQTAVRLRDTAAAGEKISGPAARRALIGATSIPGFEGALTTHRRRRSRKATAQRGCPAEGSPQSRRQAEQMAPCGSRPHPPAIRRPGPTCPQQCHPALPVRRLMERAGRHARRRAPCGSGGRTRGRPARAAKVTRSGARPWRSAPVHRGCRGAGPGSRVRSAPRCLGGAVIRRMRSRRLWPGCRGRRRCGA